MEKIIVVVGPTGSGKTDLSIQLAKQFNGEIISGDAYQCYREMSIGTAKVREDEKQGVPHYLIDILSYKEAYNVKVFQELGRKCIKKISDRGKTIIVCGGTGLYIKALLYDYVFEDEKIDESYLKQLKNMDNESLYKMLVEIDEKATESIHMNNRQRIIRALMMAHSGNKKSDRLSKQEHKPLYDAYIIGLSMEREKLYERINERVLKMIEDGLEKEVLALLKGEESFSLQSMQGIGYKEWLSYYQKEASLEDTIALIQKNSRNFAKRQYTWFKNQMNVHWYDVTNEMEREEIMKDVDSFLRNYHES